MYGDRRKGPGLGDWGKLVSFREWGHFRMEEKAPNISVF